MSARSFDDANHCAEAIIDMVGRDIRMAVPIGIGKPILLLDALYRLAEADRRIKRDCTKTLRGACVEDLSMRLFALRWSD